MTGKTGLLKPVSLLVLLFANRFAETGLLKPVSSNRFLYWF